VDLKQNFTFNFEMQPEPKPSGEAASSRLQTARKLRFLAQGDGVEPEVLFILTGKTEQIRSWRLVILDRESGREIRTLSGQQPVTSVEWDGKDEAGKWAPADRVYQCRWEETVADGSRAGESHELVAVPAEVVARSGLRVKFKILQILFKFKSAELPPEAEDKLQKAAEISRRRGPVIRQLEGYTDEIGSEAANQALSLHRAQAVKAYLENEKGLENNSLPAAGFGDKHPREQGHDAVAHAQNRRVEILLEVPEK
jgi:OOP family OmpA-OmpF porin